MIKIDNTFARSLVPERTWPVFLDLVVAAFCLAGFYSIIFVARYWFSFPVPEVVINRSPSALPLYAFYSIVRTIAAYFLSLIFAVGYGYIAAYNKRVEALMIAALDILQSIPVLSFLPGVMLAMIALIPGRQLGIELGAIVLIFTGQVWNMAFSFYSSLKSIPRELREACAINRFSAWQRFWQLELPFSAIGLIWNSMVSVAAGWFILVVCEMFPVGTRHFRLPGLGSYLQTAANNGDTAATIYGIITMMVIIVLTDQLVWRPLIVWSDKFKFENTRQRQPGELADPAPAAQLDRAGLGAGAHNCSAGRAHLCRARAPQREPGRACDGAAGRAARRFVLDHCAGDSRRRCRVGGGDTRIRAAAPGAGFGLSAALRGGGGDFSSGECSAADRLAVDDPGGRSDRLQSPARPAVAAADPDGRFISGDGVLSDHHPGACSGWALGSASDR